MASILMSLSQFASQINHVGMAHTTGINSIRKISREVIVVVVVKNEPRQIHQGCGE